MATVDSLREAIPLLHQAIVEHPDPDSKAAIAQCLQQLLKVQAKDHANTTNGAPTLSGGSAPAGPPGGSQGPPQAGGAGGVPPGLLAALQGGGGQ